MAQTETNKETNSSIPNVASLLLSLTLLMAFRLLPLLKAPLSAFGYDFGFYLDAVNRAESLNLNSLSAAVGGGYNNFLFYLIHFLHLPAEAGFNFTLFLLALLLGFTFYLAFQTKKFALFAVLLCACSIIQAESYSMFL